MDTTGGKIFHRKATRLHEGSSIPVYGSYGVVYVFHGEDVIVHLLESGLHDRCGMGLVTRQENDCERL